jgi:hypothetical protein
MTTKALIEELREKMIVSDEMLKLSPDEFIAHVKLSMKESFAIAVLLQKFLRDIDRLKK